ncbi:carbohydrate ABC transporter permease [Nocardioides sp.]|uniref:carbohydrate ABC transporter permease n=1 Tax=Nocardioides sp. TaxID=35761 RepID=UPI002732E17A|nr:carbohydrate ABC transporter permease [Nocardioides sp.]MDP3889759.1 carbohydrate ABC transporter permease [Nocardioides sp.]
MAVASSHQRLTTWLRFILAAVAAVVMVLPFVIMMSTSFKPQTLILEMPPELIPSEPTGRNYREAWTESSFAVYFANSLYVALSTTFVVLLLSSMMAYAFARFDFPGKKVAFVALLGGLMIPGIITIVPAFVLAKNLNLLDSLNGLTLFYSGGAVAFMTFLLRGFFEKVPIALDEAMTIDGAGAVRRFLHLYLPLSRPALATAAIFTFLGAWDEFVWALTVINDPGKRTLPVAIAALQGQRATEWGLVFAASAIAIIPVIVVYVIAQRQFMAGATAGAVKD